MTPPVQLSIEARASRPQLLVRPSTGVHAFLPPKLQVRLSIVALVSQYLRLQAQLSIEVHAFQLRGLPVQPSTEARVSLPPKLRARLSTEVHASPIVGQYFASGSQNHCTN